MAYRERNHNKITIPNMYIASVYICLFIFVLLTPLYFSDNTKLNVITYKSSNTLKMCRNANKYRICFIPMS